MANKLLIKLEKQQGEIESQQSQRDKVDSLHQIVTNVIQHGEDIRAIKAENTLLKDKKKKSDEHFQALMNRLKDQLPHFLL